MGLTLITPPVSEPVTLDEALAHCRITQDNEDGLVSGYIMAAREYAEGAMSRVLMAQTYDWSVDFHWPMVRHESASSFMMPYVFWRTRLELPLAPALSVTSVKYVDVNGAVQTLDPTQYVTIVNEPVSYIEPAYGVVWPVPRYQRAAILVRYVAGYGNAPDDMPEKVRQAILMLVAYWYDNRGSTQFGARGRRGGGDADVTSSILPAPIPPGVDALLSMESYTRILP